MPCRRVVASKLTNYSASTCASFLSGFFPSSYCANPTFHRAGHVLR
ncbi:hypothetical protein I3760_12G008000 [Carya illinoinensis]|nr:hypothetical protein I3760_12G008000 [Carya illinoinensis]